MLLVASGVDQDNAMLHSRPILRAIAFALTLAPQLSGAADNVSPPAIQEVVWVMPFTLPTPAYVVRPVGDGPFPLWSPLVSQFLDRHP
jgi:hypothetical protein